MPRRNNMEFDTQKYPGAWKKILHYCRKYNILMIIAILAAIGGTIATLSGPDRLQEVTDAIAEGLTGEIDIEHIRNVIIILGAIYLAGALLNLIQTQIMAYVTQMVSKQLRSDISSKINRLPMAYFGKTTTGDVLSRVTNDVDTLGQSLNQSVGTLVSAVTLFFGSIIMMLRNNVKMTGAAVGATIIGFVLMSLIMSRSQKYFRSQQKRLGEVNGFVEEAYSGHTLIKAYNGEADGRKIFHEINQKHRRAAFRAQTLSGLMMPMMGFIGNLGFVAVCVVGASLAIDGKIGFGVIVAFMVYVRLFTQPLSQISQGVQALQSASAAGGRIFEFLGAQEMEDEQDKTAEIVDTKGHVEFDHVHFGYDPDKTIINDFSAEAKPGQKVAIVGPTGAGKTTLVNLLMRFYEINSGDIRIDGVSILDLKREDVHKQFCMVLQDTWMFEGTVRENLVYSSDNITDEQMEEACRAVGLHHFIHALPKGYDTVLNDSVNLSQGQKQQMTIARAMLEDRPMLILDEATSSVDTRTELKIQKAMDALMKNRTSFVIAHRLSTIKNADLILVLKDGDVIESGTHEELMQQGGFYNELYNSQFETA
ncbi:MAG: ABC transporter ATP-binding protein/permease [Agathobacter sp.]|uniref:ABC transporter ATP-binding protein n=1 Tax=Agathobacter sp. TaxID=2021311 RepID=UPI00258912A0|nr:ABC transporter ATP-binding protein [Agathobacter sp.]MCR5677389.1 ABC transporter ATP-binding protein/permease [Agathobacter sp.]